MKTVALIPAKALDGAKSRLAPALDLERRADLALKMLQNVVRAAVETAEITTVGVISADERALSVARELTAEPIAEHGQGLNHALYLGRRWAMEIVGADSLLILLSDLPWLAAADLQEVLRLGKNAAVVIAPSKDGGTNALLLRPPDAVPFRFGPDSAGKHRREAEQRGVAVELVDRPTLAFDVDTPEDIQVALAAPATLGR